MNTRQFQHASYTQILVEPVADLVGEDGGLAFALACSGLVLRRAETLDEDDQRRLSQLCRTHIDIGAAITLAQAFATIVRERQPEQLDGWLERAEESGIAVMVSFAKGIRRDYAAVRAGVTLDFSNGPTEGHINRLKMLKRQMFGRAKLVMHPRSWTQEQ